MKWKVIVAWLVGWLLLFQKDAVAVAAALRRERASLQFVIKKSNGE